MKSKKFYAQHARDFLFFRYDVYSANVITQIVHGAPQHEMKNEELFREKTGVNAISLLLSLSPLEPRKNERKSFAADFVEYIFEALKIE